MTLQTLKSARSGAWFLNLVAGPALAIYILATLGVMRVLGFVLLWVIAQAAWGSLTNALEAAAIASVSRGRVAELDTDPSGGHLPVRLSGAMLLWVLGTTAERSGLSSAVACSVAIGGSLDTTMKPPSAAFAPSVSYKP